MPRRKGVLMKGLTEEKSCKVEKEGHTGPPGRSPRGRPGNWQWLLALKLLYCTRTVVERCLDSLLPKLQLLLRWLMLPQAETEPKQKEMAGLEKKTWAMQYIMELMLPWYLLELLTPATIPNCVTCCANSSGSVAATSLLSYGRKVLK